MSSAVAGFDPKPPGRIVRAVDAAVLGAVAGFGSPFSRSELIVATARVLELGVRVPLFESRIDAAIAELATHRSWPWRPGRCTAAV